MSEKRSAENRSPNGKTAQQAALSPVQLADGTL